MNQGVEILLARMDSNPDEFVGMDWPRQSKWSWVMDDLRKRVAPDADAREAKKEGYIPLRFLTDIEVQALWEKLESLRADQFTKAVMRTLLEEDDTLVKDYESVFGEAPVKAEGAAIRYSGFGSNIEIPYIPIKTKGRKK